MLLSNLLKKSLETATLECWERERTATPVRAFAVRLHATGCSLRETKGILALLGVKRSHQAIFQWVHRVSDSVSDPPSATPTRVAVDETAVKINGEWSWVYAAIDIETKLLLDVKVFDRHGTDQAAAFLSGLAEKHDLSDTVFLVDGYGYRTALFRIGLSGHLDYTERNLIEKWFHTLKQRIDRFHTSWVGSRPSVQQWLEQFVHYYNHQRPHQSLNNRTPVEEELN
ncbi:transposase [Haladaptatus sp. W1]|uniref:IS6 family transposase n=1 Tax=Haladaptatus sp. W1 TaxID=1897478 RepID=UPI000849A0B6|nr:IS6 family transposase [Haladaptatus sp. W1]ODR80954.1 transposase [Haladaptatus sp. W1]